MTQTYEVPITGIIVVKAKGELEAKTKARASHSWKVFETGTPTEGGSMTGGKLDCDTCGKPMPIDSHLCGECATDWNDREQRAGLRRINHRREQHGLGPLEREETP